MLSARLADGQLRRTLGKLMDKLQNKLPLFKTWGRAVELEAKKNARAYGGRRIWRNIAGATRLHSITRDGAVVECYDPIGTHKERGGPIRAKNAKALTIPISALAPSGFIDHFYNSQHQPYSRREKLHNGATATLLHIVKRKRTMLHLKRQSRISYEARLTPHEAFCGNAAKYEAALRAMKRSLFRLHVFAFGKKW